VVDHERTIRAGADKVRTVVERREEMFRGTTPKQREARSRKISESYPVGATLQHRTTEDTPGEV
jgi:hypothetical protein